MRTQNYQHSRHNMFRHGSRNILASRIRPIDLKVQLRQPITRHLSTKPSTPTVPRSSLAHEPLTARTRNVTNYIPYFLRLIPYAVAAGLSLHIFLEYGFICEGAWGISMLPTIASSGDYLIISKYYRKGRDVSVGDVVSFRNPVDEHEFAVKRVIGLPGDFVLRDTPGHSPMMIQIPVGHCWVVGDNLTWSRDSRMFGPLPLALVSGKVIAKFSESRWWPERVQNGIQNAVLDDDVD